MTKVWQIRKTAQGLWAVYDDKDCLAVECGTLETAVEWCWSHGIKPVVENVIVDTNYEDEYSQHITPYGGVRKCPRIPQHSARAR